MFVYKKTIIWLLSLLCLINPIINIHADENLSLNKQSSDQSEQTETQPIPLAELQAFAEAYYQIKINYAKPTNDADLLRAAIKGMVASLDQHSKYMDKQEFEEFMTDNEGEYAGIGISLKDNKYGLEIVEVIKNSPAARTGLTAKMLITQIDDQSVQFMSVDDAAILLKGNSGEKVKLTIAAANFAQPKEFELTREFILVESIQSQRLPEDTGYLAISQFTFHTYNEFIDAIQSMTAEHPLKNLIIDLRNNPGGIMQVALELSDLFISEGKLLISKGKTADSNQTYYADNEALLANLNVVVLINSGSASAAEILAGALHDHHKAMIIGEQSYGKGSIQTVIPLNHESGIKLTSAEYFSPLGHEIQGVGITPDIQFTTEHLINHSKITLLDDPQVLQAYNLVLKPTI